MQLGALTTVRPSCNRSRSRPREGRHARRCEEEISLTARLIREEVFPAVAGPMQCRDCAFVPICPAKSAGSVLAQ